MHGYVTIFSPSTPTCKPVTSSPLSPSRSVLSPARTNSGSSSPSQAFMSLAKAKHHLGSNHARPALSNAQLHPQALVSVSLQLLFSSLDARAVVSPTQTRHLQSHTTLPLLRTLLPTTKSKLRCPRVPTPIRYDSWPASHRHHYATHSATFAEERKKSFISLRWHHSFVRSRSRFGE